MKEFWEKLSALARVGILSAFLSLLFAASVGGRSDGREIPFPVGVLNDPGCYVIGCHMVPGSTLNEVGSVAFNNLPERFVPGETYDVGITITGGTTYGFQVAVVFSDDTQAGAPTAVTGATIVNEVDGGQLLTQTSPLETGKIDFHWTAPLEPKERSVTFKVASTSANNNSAPTADAINTLESSVPLELTEKLYFAQFANGDGLISQISLLTLDSEEPVNATLELLDDDGAPPDVVLNGEMVAGETEIFRIAAGGAAVFASDGEGPVVPGSVTVTTDGPVSRVIRTGVAVVNPGDEETALQVRLLDLEGFVVGTGTISANPLAGRGHVARFLDEFNWDEPAPDLTDFQGGLEVNPSNGQVAGTVLRSSPGNLASLPVAPIQ